ncbi:MAG TPA: hypothetical protein VID03_06100 [Acidimicrobiia bacterium]|jgi:hypothetical protein
MFEAVEYVEARDRPGEPVAERHLGEFSELAAACDTARQALGEFLTTGSSDYAWWIVRQRGARMASWIADSRSQKEFVLDLSSGQLVETG